MADSRIDAFHNQMKKVIAHLHGEYAKLQTGRASAVLVEGVTVEAYGQMQPLKAVAGINIQDARTIAVQPWDRSIMGNVEKALIQADLGTTPTNDGVVLRIVLPPMTEERRLQLKKVVQQLAEEARISVRQQRQEVHDSVKKEEDEDLRYTLLENLEEAVKKANDEIDQTRKKKEEEIMTI